MNMPSRRRPPASLLRRVLRFIGTLLMVPVIFFEEWGWRPLARLMRWIGHLPLMRGLEARIRRTPPRFALALFLVPALALLPFKFGALWLIAQGHKVGGICIILLAKLVGTALLGRLFVLTEPQLMSIPWFARVYGWWRATKERVMARIRASMAWRTAVVLGHRLRRRWRRA